MSNGGEGGSSVEVILIPIPDKEYFASDRPFLFICVCVAVSYQSIVWFPLLMLKHGGVCFLIPYIVLLVLVGVPMAALELTVGQFLGRGTLDMWTSVPVGKGVGMAMLLKTFIMSTYKVMKDSYSFYYFLQAFQTELPWSNCFTWWGANVLNCVARNKTKTRFCNAEKVRLYDENINKNLTTTENSTVVEVCGRRIRLPPQIYANGTSDVCRDNRPVTELSFLIHGMLKLSSGIDDFGGIRWELLVCYIFSWFLVFMCVSKGVSSLARVSPFLAIVPFCTLIVVAARLLFLPGGRDSILTALRPHWDHVISLNAWSDAIYYVTSGLEIGTGKLHAFASYNSFESTGVFWSFIILPVFLTFSGIIGSVMLFSASGSLAETLGMCISDLGVYQFVFPFVTFPEVVLSMSLPALWTGLFYLTIYMISIDDMLFNVGMIVSSAEDLFPSIRLSMDRVVFFVCISMFISGMPTVTQAGPYVVSLLEDHVVAGVISLCIPLLEVTIFMWVYGIQRFSFDVEYLLKKAPGFYMKACWVVICPLVLSLFYVHRLGQFEAIKYSLYTFPREYEALAWIIGGTALLQVPLGTVAIIFDNIKYPARAFLPEYHWEPNTPGEAYFEEMEEQRIGMATEEGPAPSTSVLYADTSMLEVTVDPDAPKVFNPPL